MSDDRDSSTFAYAVATTALQVLKIGSINFDFCNIIWIEIKSCSKFLHILVKAVFLQTGAETLKQCYRSSHQRCSLKNVFLKFQKTFRKIPQSESLF